MAIDLLTIIGLIKDPDLRIKITQLYGENLHLKEENHKLKEKSEKVKNIEEIQSKLEYKGNQYYMGEKGPFCSRCWDSDQKLVRIHVQDFSNGVQYYNCPNCKDGTKTGTYIQPAVGGIDWEIY